MRGKYGMAKGSGVANRLSMELRYDGKQGAHEIVANIPAGSLKKVKSFGQQRFDGWQNILIFGDNLPALKALMDDPNVAGQVRIIYIDPPFATGQDFRSGSERTSTVSWSKKDESAYEDRLTGAEYIDFAPTHGR